MNTTTTITHLCSSDGEILGREVTYWSVYEQRWRTVTDIRLIPDRELAAMPSNEREWLLDEIND
jgi:hypothetical protein